MNFDRRGFFRMAVAGVFGFLAAPFGWKRPKKARFYAEFKHATLPAHQEYVVCVFHRKEFRSDGHSTGWKEIVEL